MAGHHFLSSSSQNQTRSPISSFFGSPRFFSWFLPKGLSQIETISTPPISILVIGKHDESQYSKLPRTFSGNKHPWEKTNPIGIVGLALVDSILNDEKTTENNFSQSNNRIVVFGSNLKIQIPRLPPSLFSISESPKSPPDFGIKTRNSQLVGSLSPPGSVNYGTQTTKNFSRAFSGFLSATEMELSEDYTRVISHGPNPRTTHIFDNSIVESCCGVVGLSELKMDYFSSSETSKSPLETFLSFCHTCRKSLEQGKDIYMYRGEQAFCSMECRCEEMVFHGVDNPDPGNVFRAKY